MVDTRDGRAVVRRRVVQLLAVWNVLQRLYWRSGGIGTMVSLASENSQRGTMDCGCDDCVGAWTISRHTNILRSQRKPVAYAGPAGRGC